MKMRVDDSYKRLASLYVRRQVRALSRPVKGARRAEDIECVHQVRVASRRLRSALRVFRGCFPAGKMKAWRKAIRRVTRRLGPVRDKDVQIEFVKEFLRGLKDKAARPGIRRLLLRLRQERLALQPQLCEALDHFMASGVLRDMRAAPKAVLADLKDVPLQSPFVFATARREILGKLRDLLAIEDCLADPKAKQRHHEMRIATKRLRYKMEACQQAYGGFLAGKAALLPEVKQVQSLLGKVHDCDVWIDYLPVFLEQEGQRTRQYLGHTRPLRRLEVGIEYLREDRQKRRAEAFGELAEYWRELKARGFWDRLRKLLRCPGSKPPRRAAGGKPAPKPQRTRRKRATPSDPNQPRRT